MPASDAVVLPETARPSKYRIKLQPFAALLVNHSNHTALIKLQISAVTPRLVFATQALTTPDLEGRVTAGMRAAREIGDEIEQWQNESCRSKG